MPVSQVVVLTLRIMWIMAFRFKPGTPVVVSVVDNPPTDPDFVNYKVPKGTVNVRPGVVPATVPGGVNVELK